MRVSKLIRGCIKKDKRAWEAFLKKYSRLIYWAINARLEAINSGYQQSDIEDIFQEVFLALLKNGQLGQLKDKKALPGWLTMVASNKATDYMRKKFRNREELVCDFPNIVDYSFEENLMSRNTFFLIDKIINNLSSKEKIVISLSILEEKTHREISQITSTSINTVSTIVSRAKEKIKKELKKMKEKCD